MVTGIQFISNARITDTAFRELTTYLGMTVPVPEPIAALAMIPAFEIEGSKGKTKSSQSISRLLDEKVWAAQFSQVEVKFLKGLDADGPLTRLITLREPVDLKLGGIRGKNHTDETTPTGSEKYAEVSGLHYEKGDQKNTEEDTILDEILDADWELYDTYSQN